MKCYSWRSVLLAAITVLSPAISRGAIHTYDNLDLTTAPNPGGGGSDGTGIWFNPLTGYVENRGFLFPTPLFEDGKFFLLLDTSFTTPAAQVFTQGFFSRGNGVVYESNSNLNPKRFADGAVIGPGVGYQSPGAGFPDLGPTFGNFASGGHGYIGLTIRDASGSLATDVFYGYAEINVNANFSVTLLSFAYNDVRGEAIRTVSTIPEPASLTLAGLGVAGAFLLRRRKA